MAATPSQLDSPPPSRWKRICHRLGRGLGFLYGTLLLGFLLNLISNTLSFGIIVTWVEQHVLFAGLIGGSLLLLPALVWIGQRETASLAPAHAALSTDQRNRTGILAALHKAYTDELAASLQGVARIALGLHERFDLTHPARLAAWHPGEPERIFPDGTTILDVYQQAGHGLLILGEPGAGKTTLLYDLALALLTRAEADETHPLPVVLNLSSWATKRQPLHLWLVEELELRYLIPHRLGSRWVQEGRFQLLLDGLDEVAASARGACIEAINTYHAEHLLPLVICSRREEYEVASQRLTLQSAVIVQPLTLAQVNAYLKEAGKGLSAVRKVVQTNAVLQELLTTPLMLSVVTMAYQGKTTRDLPQMGTASEQQQQIFARYLQRMLHLSAKPRNTTPEQLHHALSWLAHQMQQRSQSVFYLEQLQPHWLTTRLSMRLYDWLGIRLPGVVIGALIAILVGILFSGIYTAGSPGFLRASAIAPLYGLVGGCMGALLSKFG